MARIGYRKGKYNEIDTATNKYKALTGGTVPEFEKVVDEKFAPEFNSAELYANLIFSFICALSVFSFAVVALCKIPLSPT